MFSCEISNPPFTIDIKYNNQQCQTMENVKKLISEALGIDFSQFFITNSLKNMHICKNLNGYKFQISITNCCHDIKFHFSSNSFTKFFTVENGYEMKLSTIIKKIRRSGLFFSNKSYHKNLQFSISDKTVLRIDHPFFAVPANQVVVMKMIGNFIHLKYNGKHYFYTENEPVKNAYEILHHQFKEFTTDDLISIRKTQTNDILLQNYRMKCNEKYSIDIKIKVTFRRKSFEYQDLCAIFEYTDTVADAKQFLTQEYSSDEFSKFYIVLYNKNQNEITDKCQMLIKFLGSDNTIMYDLRPKTREKNSKRHSNRHYDRSIKQSKNMSRKTMPIDKTFSDDDNKFGLKPNRNCKKLTKDASEKEIHSPCNKAYSFVMNGKIHKVFFTNDATVMEFKNHISAICNTIEISKIHVFFRGREIDDNLILSSLKIGKKLLCVIIINPYEEKIIDDDDDDDDDKEEASDGDDYIATIAKCLRYYSDTSLHSEDDKENTHDGVNDDDNNDDDEKASNDDDFDTKFLQINFKCENDESDPISPFSLKISIDTKLDELEEKIRGECEIKDFSIWYLINKIQRVQIDNDQTLTEILIGILESNKKDSINNTFLINKAPKKDETRSNSSRRPAKSIKDLKPKLTPIKTASSDDEEVYSGKEAKQYQIFSYKFKINMKDEIHKMRLERNATVKAFKEIISKEYKETDLSNIHVLFSGQEIEDNLVLSELKIRNDLLYVNIINPKDSFIKTAKALKIGRKHYEYNNDDDDDDDYEEKSSGNDNDDDEFDKKYLQINFKCENDESDPISPFSLKISIDTKLDKFEEIIKDRCKFDNFSIYYNNSKNKKIQINDDVTLADFINQILYKKGPINNTILINILSEQVKSKKRGRPSQKKYKPTKLPLPNHVKKDDDESKADENEEESSSHCHNSHYSEEESRENHEEEEEDNEPKFVKYQFSIRRR